MRTELEEKLVKKYPQFFEYLKEYRGPLMPITFGFEHGDGWYDLIDKLMGDILEHYQKIPTENQWNLELHQVKEKFGGLRFYLGGADDYVWDLIDNAEDESYKICEFCGSRENVGQTDGWITTCCKECFDSNKTNMSVWTPIKENND